MPRPRYTNLDGTTPDKGLADLLKWQWERRRARTPRTPPPPPPRATPDARLLGGHGPSATWIGHATFVLRLAGKTIATDPVWSDRLHTVRRVSPPGAKLEELPPIDLVTVSHAHYDHLDLPTLERIGPSARYVVPRDVGRVLRRRGLRDVVELGWFETHVEGDLELTLVPAQHWSMRTPFDRNASLWGGFVLRGGGTSVYHAGDTAFSRRTFEAVRDGAPPIDWALLPIGAYEPRWFMGPQHMSPEDAVQAFGILGARRFVAMHWGTFALTDEPLDEPPALLRRAFAAAGHATSALHVPALGETLDLSTP